MASSADITTTNWREAGETHDIERAVSCLAETIQIISPLTARFRFRGRGQARDMLTAAFHVIETITYHTEVGDSFTRALFYDGRCGREEFEEAQLLRFDNHGLITELTFFGRPLPGLTAVMAAIGPAMLRDKRRRSLAVMIGAATAPLATLTRIGERHVAPLVDPQRLS